MSGLSAVSLATVFGKVAAGARAQQRRNVLAFPVLQCSCFFLCSVSGCAREYWHRPIHIVSASCGRRSLLVVQHERFCSLLYTNRSFRDIHAVQARWARALETMDGSPQASCGRHRLSMPGGDDRERSREWHMG